MSPVTPSPLAVLRQKAMIFFLDHCRPPTVDELSALTHLPASDVSSGLQSLEAAHHLVLYNEHVPSPTPIAMMHPFSHLPSNYKVAHRAKSWYANCAWCALGLASMLPPSVPTTITTLEGGIPGSHMVVTVQDDTVVLNGGNGESGVHFSVPPSKWWADVRFACGTIMLFRAREESKKWCDERGFAEGEWVGLQEMWKLAKFWYHDKASLDYVRKTEEEKEVAFKEFGMTGTFWKS